MLEFHHIGLLVENIENSILHYITLFGKENISRIIDIDSQKVKVCFIKVGDGSYVELVEPIGVESKVYMLLKKRVSYYHIGYKVKNIIVTVEKLEALNYKPMSFFSSEAFEGKNCIFLYTPEGHLIELIQE